MSNTQTDDLAHRLQGGRVEMPGRVRTPPAPGEESAGPPLTEMVALLGRTVAGLDALYRQARQEAVKREYHGVASGQTDANGDLAVRLYEVPQGATGKLLYATFDLAGVTPASPMTAATLWHGIYAAPAGASTLAQVVAVGAMLDCQPDTVAADTQLPFPYHWDYLAGPGLVGPGAFYAVVDATTAARQLAVRFGVCIEQPEP